MPVAIPLNAPHRPKTSDFHYHLPKDRIAQHPTPSRDGSRLMGLDRATGAIRHHSFRELPSLLNREDLLIVNDTRVLPARLFAKNTGAKVLAVTSSPPKEERRVS